MSLEKASKQKADKRVLYVGGLEDEVTDKLVHAAFVPFGEIQQIDVPKIEQMLPEPCLRN